MAPNTPILPFRRVGEPLPIERENKQLEPSMGVDDIAPVSKILTERDFYVNLIKVEQQSAISETYHYTDELSHDSEYQ